MFSNETLTTSCKFLPNHDFFLPYCCFFLNCFCVPFILNLNPFAFVNRYFWNLIAFPSIDFGNRNNFLIFHSSASYVIMKKYLFSFL